MESEKVVSIQKLNIAFGTNKVLKGVDLNLYRGENLVVLGKSGTGKSVLIKCIVNLIEPDSGNIEAFGIDVITANQEELNRLRQKIGFLFQGAALYDSMTVKENLEFPLRRHFKKVNRAEIDEKVITALQNVGLEQSLHKMPSELSGGMKKRIGLARSLILEPEIMLYDEPTTGLDPITSNEISELIIEVREKFKTSSIIITHDIKCAQLTSNRIVILNEGKIFAEGQFDELSKSNDKFIASFFNTGH
jgi:phospholipid/cholesterol/gamma-HCH transport system ATP-binding protein